MSYDSDLDTSSYPCSQIELVDSNHIHIIQIILYVTLLYTAGINEVYTVIILRNSYQFSVKFVLFSVYFSSITLHNNTIQLHSFPKDQWHNNLTYFSNRPKY